MREMEILPANEGKGRTFRALCLASIEADSLWGGGSTSTDDARPVWVMFAGAENEVRPFMANLTLGRKARLCKMNQRREERMELLKSAKYHVTYQREAEGTIATAFLPDLFRLDPGMVDPAGVAFILLPSKEWVQDQKIETGSIVVHAVKCGYEMDAQELSVMVPLAYLFAAYLDRRTRCPLLADPRFYLQLLLACLTEGLASWQTDRGYTPYYNRNEVFGRHTHMRFHEISTEDVGLLPGIAFKASHERVEEVLAEQVDIFFKVTGGR